LKLPSECACYYVVLEASADQSKIQVFRDRLAVEVAASTEDVRRTSSAGWAAVPASTC
jgi:hypothetical protein